MHCLCLCTPAYAACMCACVLAGRVSGRWYAFYQVKNLASSKGEIGVAQSMDSGETWQHLGIALHEPHPLTSPFITYDAANAVYVMIPDTHKAHEHAVHLYTTTKTNFPFGWKLLKTALQGEHYMDTSAVHYQGLWWIFTTVGACGPRAHVNACMHVCVRACYPMCVCDCVRVCKHAHEQCCVSCTGRHGCMHAADLPGAPTCAGDRPAAVGASAQLQLAAIL